MSENEEKITQQETDHIMTPEEMADNYARGKMKLKTPIMDGEKSYDELTYDFNGLTSGEMARALDGGAGRGSASGTLNNTQALALFAAAAAKSTGGLDAQDIRDRIGIGDAIAAVNVASLFFRASLVAAGARISKE